MASSPGSSQVGEECHREFVTLTRMKRLSLALFSLLLVAASAQDVLSDLNSQGYYIEDGASATADVVGNAVAEAGFDGGRLYVVVLSDEPTSGATFFSDAVLDSLGQGTVFTVAPETVGFASVGGTWSADQLNAAVDASLAGSDDNDVVARFVSALTGSDIGPDLPVDQGSAGGGGSGIIWFLIIVGAMVVLFLYLRRRSSKTSGSGRMSPQVAQFHEAAQAKLADIANDILEMEDEVRLSDNSEAKGHYQKASATYAELVDTVQQVSNVEGLVDVIYRLDVAIWELDVAEALLDGKPAPAKPEKTKVEVRPEGPPRVSARPPVEFDRRPQRQSTPAGPDMSGILMALLAMQNMGGIGRTPGQIPGGFGGSGGSRSSGGGMRRSMGGGRIRGGGRRRG